MTVQMRLLTLSVELANDCVNERVLRCDVSSADRHRVGSCVSRRPDRPSRPPPSTAVASFTSAAALPSLNARRFHHISTCTRGPVKRRQWHGRGASASCVTGGGSSSSSNRTEAMDGCAAAVGWQYRARRHSAQDTHCAVRSQRVDTTRHISRHRRAMQSTVNMRAMGVYCTPQRSIARA